MTYNSRFLQCIVCESLPVVMLAVPDRLWNTILEPDHVVFPVAHVVPNGVGAEIDSFIVQRQEGSIVESIKIHVKDIDEARRVRRMVIDDNSAADRA